MKTRELVDKMDSLIPRGPYCYTIREIVYPNGPKNAPVIRQNLCPYWDRDINHDEQENGYCHYMKSGDWESEGFSLLWDQVKECRINEYTEEEEEELWEEFYGGGNDIF